MNHGPPNSLVIKIIGMTSDFVTWQLLLEEGIMW